MRRDRRHDGLGIYALFMLGITLVLLTTLVLAGVIVGVWDLMGVEPGPRYALSLLLACALVGLAMGRAFARREARPIDALIEGMRRVAAGDFDVRLDERAKGPMAEANANFNKMVTALGQTEMLRDDFVANVSHEFKSPLTSIQGYATLLQEPGLTDAQRTSYTGAILEATRQLSRMSGVILRLSRLENDGGAPLDRTRYALDEQLRHAVLAFVPVWDERGIAFEVDLPDDEVAIDANEELLGEVWQNLLDNATKFTAAGGSIAVSLEVADGTARVVVRDSGCGMDAETAAHAFDKFYQGDRSHASAGNGLGLALVKEVVERHGGSVGVTSAPGQGSAFTVTLPLASAMR